MQQPRSCLISHYQYVHHGVDEDKVYDDEDKYDDFLFIVILVIHILMMVLVAEIIVMTMLVKLIRMINIMRIQSWSY